MHFLDIGYSHYSDASKIIGICKPGSSPIRKQLIKAKEEDRHIDCTEGKKTRSIIFSECGDKIIATSSTVQTITLIERMNRIMNQKTERDLGSLKSVMNLGEVAANALKKDESTPLDINN